MVLLEKVRQPRVRYKAENTGIGGERIKLVI
jgi:hypothetical protein